MIKIIVLNFRILFFRWLLGYFLCYFRQFISAASIGVIFFTMVLSALHRYLIIVHNRKIKIFHDKSLLWLLPLIWLLASSISVTFVYPGSAFIIMYRHQCAVVSQAATGLFFAFAALNVGIPIIIVPVLYLRIYCVVYKAHKMTRKQNHRQQAASASNNANVNKKQKRIALILFILYAEFTVTYLPYLVTLMLPPIKDIHQRRLVDSLVWIFIYIGFAVNPILYGVLFDKVRKAYKQFGKWNKIGNDRIVELTATQT